MTFTTSTPDGSAAPTTGAEPRERLAHVRRPAVPADSSRTHQPTVSAIFPRVWPAIFAVNASAACSKG